MSIYNDAEKKIIVEALIENYGKAIKREDSVNRSKADKEAAWMKVDEMRDNGDPLPTDCGYESFEEWALSLVKRATADSNSLNRIEEQKVLIEVFEFYLANV